MVTVLLCALSLYQVQSESELIALSFIANGNANLRYLTVYGQSYPQHHRCVFHLEWDNLSMTNPSGLSSSTAIVVIEHSGKTFEFLLRRWLRKSRCTNDELFVISVRYLF